MKNRFIILLCGAMLFALTSCIEDFMVIRGNGISTTESHRTAPFYRLENSTSIDVIYKKSHFNEKIILFSLLVINSLPGTSLRANGN